VNAAATSAALPEAGTFMTAYLSLANLADAGLTKADLRDVRGLLGEQLQQSANDAYSSLQGKFDRPRWDHTQARETLPRSHNVPP
jgi:hypothetical protein